MTTHTGHKGEVMTDIGRLKELEAKATKGEWSSVLSDDPRGQPSPLYRGLVCLIKHDGGGALAVVADSDFVSPDEWAANTAFIAALRNAAPHLLSEIETLRAENERLKVALRDIAAFNDGLANDRLASTGSYAAFDEPWSVEIARNALAAYDQGKVTI